MLRIFNSNDKLFLIKHFRIISEKWNYKIIAKEETFVQTFEEESKSLKLNLKKFFKRMIDDEENNCHKKAF